MTCRTARTFVGVDPASAAGDKGAWTIFRFDAEGKVEVIEAGTCDLPLIIDLPRDQWSETK